MKESELKTILESLHIEWSEFVKFIAHKTISELDSETFYYLSDIEYFLYQTLQERRGSLEQFKTFEEVKCKEVVDFYSTFEVKDVEARKQMIARVFRVGFDAALDFLVKTTKTNDIVFAKKIATSFPKIQEMIDKSIEKHKPKI